MTVRIASALVLIAALLVPAPAGATVPAPTVTGPVTGGIHGHALWDSWYDLSEIGYVEHEYFVSGLAATSPTAARDTAYTTRIIVRHPAAAEDFNGTVLLDWVNVTAQFENAVDTIEAHPMLHREGWAYVHVSAQAAGICCSPLTPKVWDPVRYAPLAHPGDAYSFDIFSQVAQAIRAPAGIDVMDGLTVERIIAAGQSQSAGRLSTYVRAHDTGVIDALLIHSGGSKTFEAPPPVPVLHLASDSEATPEEPNQTENYVLWEVAGSSHSDFWVDYHQEIGQGPRVAGAPQQPASADEEMHRVAGNYGEQIHPRQLTCIAGGSLFPIRYSVSAALHHLDAWVRDGTVPPRAPRFAFAGGMLARDGFGNVLGGIRLPPIDVPVARYVSTICGLGGITIPFTPVELDQLYDSHARYVCLMTEATARSVDEGFLLPDDAADLMERVEAAGNRFLEGGNVTCS